MKFCCDLLDGLVKNAGKAGFSVVLMQYEALRGFFLQGRAHDADQEDKLRNMPRATDPPRPFVMVMQQGIKFCPFCGTSLDSTIVADDEEFTELVREHESLAMG